MTTRKEQCKVVGCRNPHKCVFGYNTAAEDLKQEWLLFIFNNNIPAAGYKGKLYVCANHFSPDSFKNYGQYNAGLAARLILLPGAKPTVRDLTEAETPSVSNLC